MTRLPCRAHLLQSHRLLNYSLQVGLVRYDFIYIDNCFVIFHVLNLIPVSHSTNRDFFIFCNCHSLLPDVRRNIGIIEKAVQAKELRLLARVLRSTGGIRKQLIPGVVSKAITCYVPDSYSSKSLMLECLSNIPVSAQPAVPMEVDAGPKNDGKSADKKVPSAPISPATPNCDALLTAAHSSTPEVAAYLHLLVLLAVLDAKQPEKAVPLSTALVHSLAEYNRRTMDELNARAYFYFARSVELTGQFATIRTALLSAFRTATLHHDAPTQAVLLNLLLRNYIAYNLYDQADKLLSRTRFPETRSNNQLARYLYYTGRVKAIQLDYTEALWNLQQALRKAPQNSGFGFRISVQKFMIIVDLLTGEVPARDIFRQAHMQRALRPYLALTQAVRVGDMDKFKLVLETSADEFESDSTMSLIMRLRHNVIKTGLRMLSSSYSRISLTEVCKRLQLESVENTEGVVAKAIHDGVIDAIIDHDGGFMRSNETVDVYSTTEPADAYHARVEFCLNVYNEAIRAMRFPEQKDEEDAAEQRRERFKEQEELAKTLAEEEEDEFEP